MCGGRTLLRGVQQLRPGHILSFDRTSAAAAEECYWNPVSVAQEAAFSRSPSDREFLDDFRETVDHHLIADVPVGVQFSGGVDSSLISAVTGRDLGVTLNGFHCRVDDRGLDESGHALNVARELGMDVQVALLDDRTFLSDLLERLTWFHDEPLAHPNSLGIYLVSRLAREKVTVLLSGESADEFFGGYGRYPLLLVHRLAKRPIRLFATSDRLYRPLARGQGRLAAVVRYARQNRYLSADEQIASGPDYMDADDLSDILGDADAISRSLEQRLQLVPRQESLDIVTRCQLFDVRAYLPPLLMRQDKMSMAASIENRVPFATPAVFSTAMSLPSRSRASLFRRKHFLKRLLAQYIPSAMARRQKQGFGIPLQSWLKKQGGAERLQGLVASDSPLQRVVDIKKVRNLVSGFRGERSQADVLWTLLSLKLWMDIFCHPGKGPVLREGTVRTCN